MPLWPVAHLLQQPHHEMPGTIPLPPAQCAGQQERRPWPVGQPEAWLGGSTLMGGRHGLDNAVLWKIPAVIGLEASIEAVLEAGAQAHVEVLLTREGASCTHELLEVSLYRADNLIAVTVHIHLADMINGCVWLHGVAGAHLEEHGMPKRSRRKPNIPAFIVEAHLRGVSSGGREVKF